MLQNDEAETLRTQILSELGELLHEQLAATAWSRLLVELVTDGQGEVRVASVEAEDVVDDARLDETFGDPRSQAMMPVLAQAISALTALAGADLASTGGGTLVRLAGGAFAFLPGRVRAPSEWFEAHGDKAVAAVRARHAALPFALSDAARVDVDAGEGRISLFANDGGPLGNAPGLVLGAFSRVSRAWTWGWAIPSLPGSARSATKAALDGVLDRGGWEISTEQFGTDEPTATTLCAIACELIGASGLVRVPHAEGAVFVALGHPVSAGALQAGA